MNNESLRKVLNEQFSVVMELEDGTGRFRAEKLHNGEPYQIAYFDSRNILFNRDFDLNSYQTELLVSDFYSSESALQWNFYLYFIIDNQQQALPNYSETKHLIEGDRKLARKYVVTLNEFEELNRPNIRPTHQPVDILDRWKETLPELGGIFDTSLAMNNVVASYIETTKPSKLTRKPKLVKVNKFPFIKTLSLAPKYRAYPKKRHFEFGIINLIKGPNAVGKTSLLEAIELTICGDTLRRGKKDALEPFEFEISTFDNPQIQKISRQTPNEYRSRDHHWYGRTLKSGNSLRESFNRFNYFDADAAANFSSKVETTDGYSKSLNQIIFGPEVDIIFSRITTINDLFKDRKKDFEASLKREDQVRHSWQNEIAAHSKNKIEALTQQALGNRLVNLGIKFDDSGVNSLLNQISHASVVLSSWKAVQVSYGITDIASFSNTEGKLKELKLKISSYEQSLNHINSSEKSISNNLLIIRDKLIKLERVSAYIATGAIHLRALENTRKIIQGEISRLESGIHAYGKIDIKSLENYKDITLDLAMSGVITRLETLREDENITQNKINSLKVTLDQLSVLYKEIEVIGSSLVKLSPKIDECPLCFSDLKPGNLSHRLLAGTVNAPKTDSSVLLEKILNDSVKLAVERVKLQAELNSIESLKEAASFLNDSDICQKSVREILNSLKDSDTLYENLKKQLSGIEKDISQYEFKTFSVSEIDQLLEDLELDTTNTEFAANIARLVNDFNDSQRDQLQKLEKYRIEKKEIHTNIQALSIMWPILGNNPTSKQVSTFITEIQYAHKLVESLSDILVLEPSDTMDVVNAKLNEGKELSIRYLESLKAEENFRNLEIQISKSEKLVKELRAKLARIELALTALNKVIVNQRPENVLNEFIQGHELLITNIFNQIHSPKEFDGITLRHNKLSAQRKSDGRPVSLTTLSTGQRTAYVLAVFLAMNQSLKQGPDVLLFDDPVVYVDDLNILSFIDYLQKLALEGNKQVFFATANNKIASLFAKKFDFLRNDKMGFKEIELSRIEYATHVDVVGLVS